MALFTHFEDGIYISENTYRKPEYVAGDFEHIFDDGLVVVDLGVEQIRDCLCDGALLGSLDLNQEQVESTFSSLPQDDSHLEPFEEEDY